MIRQVAAGLGAMTIPTLGCGGSTPDPATLSSLGLSPAILQGGVSSTGTLTAAAPSCGASVSLASSHPSASPSPLRAERRR
jgi:hypothetical protein